MKKIIIVQSIPYVLEMIKGLIDATFPNLGDRVIYQSDFEKTLAETPSDGDLVVIASDNYHDKEHHLVPKNEKNGNRLAQEIKKINPLAKVYIFSTDEPGREYIDGFYQKKNMGDDTLQELVDIFTDLDLAV